MNFIDCSERILFPMPQDHSPILSQQDLGHVEPDFEIFDLLPPSPEECTGVEVYKGLKETELISRALTLPMLSFLEDHPDSIPALYQEEGVRLFFWGTLLKDDRISREEGWDPAYPLEKALVYCLVFEKPYEDAREKKWIWKGVFLEKTFGPKDLGIFLKV